MQYLIVALAFSFGLGFVLAAVDILYNLIRFAVYKYFGGKKSIKEYFKNI